MSWREYKGYIYAVILAATTGLIAMLVGEDPTIVRINAKPHSPDYFSSGYVKTEMDETGQLSNTLVAETMTHFADDGTTHLERPELVLMNDNTPPWVIHSETGVLSADGLDLLLNGKAVVSRAAGNGNRALTINSSNLRVKPDQNYAETDDWAELLSPPNRTEGIGMKLNYGEPIHVELFSKVRGKYEVK